MYVHICKGDVEHFKKTIFILKTKEVFFFYQLIVKLGITKSKMLSHARYFDLC